MTDNMDDSLFVLSIFDLPIVPIFMSCEIETPVSELEQTEPVKIDQVEQVKLDQVCCDEPVKFEQVEQANLEEVSCDEPDIEINVDDVKIGKLVETVEVEVNKPKMPINNYRTRAIERYLAKRPFLNYSKKVKYTSRSNFAKTRKRVEGHFVCDPSRPCNPKRQAYKRKLARIQRMLLDIKNYEETDGHDEHDNEKEHDEEDDGDEKNKLTDESVKQIVVKQAVTIGPFGTECVTPCPGSD